jgi:hypothetical protein
MIPLGCRTYRDAKAERDGSMFEKAGYTEAIKVQARRDPDGMVKADCCLNPSAQSVKCTNWKGWLISRVPQMRRRNRIRLQHAPRDRVGIANLKDTNGEPATVLNVTHTRNAGSPNGREPHGDGASVVVRGRESRPHGEGRQVDRNERTPGEVRCFRTWSTRTFQTSGYWRAVCAERCQHGSGGGGWKRTSIRGNALTAYLTREGAAGNVPPQEATR